MAKQSLRSVLTPWEAEGEQESIHKHRRSSKSVSWGVGIIVENRTRPDFMTFYCRGATAVLLKKADDGYRVLLIKRADSYEGAWCFVAGKIEQGEKAWQTVLREIREETNLVPSTLYSADIFEQFYQAEHEWVWVAPVFVGLITEQQKVKLNEEHSEFCWFTMEEAGNMLQFPGQRIILEHIEKEFIKREPCLWLKINIGGAY